MENKTLEWLLEDSNPAIKYRTLTEICGEQPDSCRAVYNSIWEQKPVERMFSKQDENGLWANDSYEYLSACAELGLHKDERLDNYVNFIVKSMTDFLDNNDEDFGCRAPLMLRALVMMGYHEKSDVKKLITRCAATQLYDGGFNCQRLLKKNPGRKSCYKAALQGLLLYAECKRKNILPANADKLLDYFLKRDIFYSSDRTKNFKDGRADKGWRFIDNFFPAEPLRTGLPLIISSLSVLGAGNHPALTEAWELLKAKKYENGRMKLDGTLSKFPYNFGAVGKENKWVTFYAALAEKFLRGGN
ncbi:MAG: hypothetical protein FWE82_04320 [Defluviitaleaceae bacterium]|nr:hypothetical protein [Defluviitaleaceae bacterium]